MNILNKVWHNTIFYNLYDYVLTAKEYNEDKEIVDETLHSDGFQKVINHYLNTTLKYNTSNGEPYCVVNPNLKRDGSLDTDSIIMEIDGDNTNTNEYVRTWLYKRLKLIDQLFKVGELYNYINVIQEHVGPTNQDNYLLIFRIASKDAYVEKRNKFWIHMTSLLGVAGIITGLVFLL